MPCKFKPGDTVCKTTARDIKMIVEKCTIVDGELNTTWRITCKRYDAVSEGWLQAGVYRQDELELIPNPNLG